ncbi:MAG TPA: hypothetical protein VF139_18145 [Candidatus Polarisedimenticolaceae bacterium]
MLRTLLACLVVLAAPPAAASDRIVFCAPGYPGSTAQAQPAMDAFAAALASASKRAAGDISAVYHETEAAGLEALRAGETTLAIVPWPFFVKHREALGLQAQRTLVPKGSPAPERWSLVAGKGKVAGASDLSGFRLVTGASYAPAFVSDALAAWGALPADVALEPAGSILTALRRAAGGEKIALLLDGAQGASMSTLPFAASLEVVARSPEYPPAVLCRIRGRGGKATAALLEALDGLPGTPEGRAALEGLRLERILPR